MRNRATVRVSSLFVMEHLFGREFAQRVKLEVISSESNPGDSEPTLVLHISRPTRDLTYAALSSTDSVGSQLSDARSVSYFLAAPEGTGLAGAVQPAATLPVTHVMLQAVRDWKTQTGELRGVKPAGGIRSTKDAIKYLVAVHEVAGPEWLDPHLFRFGASTLLNDLLMQRRTQLDGHYSGPDYVTVD